MEPHLTYLDANDAFILRYAHKLTIKQIAGCLSISCEEVNDRYDNLFFIHVACQTPIDKEYHKHCTKLLRGFAPVGVAEGLLHKKRFQ